MTSEGEKEVLVVISKLKNYIRTASGMNTAGTVGPVLSEIIRKLCDEAIEHAKKDGRKTVMDRDFPCQTATTATASVQSVTTETTTCCTQPAA